MRFGNFESPNQEPISKSEDKEVFIDPNNENRVISKRKGEQVRSTPNQLKGKYYLTKIVHALLPQYIPDIYQVGESRDGVQTTDRERIAHEDIAENVEEISSKLDKFGIDLVMDDTSGVFSKDESGNAYYSEELNPWQEDSTRPEGIEMLFSEKKLRKAILKMPDESAKKQCEDYLERLLALAEEEKIEIEKAKLEKENNKRESGLEVAQFEVMIAYFEATHSLEALNAIITEEEAFNSEERKAAKAALIPIWTQLNILRNETDITSEQVTDLDRKYKKLNMAIGVVSGGKVDHTR